MIIVEAPTFERVVGEYNAIEMPTLEWVAEEYEGIHASLNAAENSLDWEVALRRWDDLRRHLSSWSELTYLRFNQDTQNELYKAARDYCDQLTPKLMALEVNMKHRLLASPYRFELEQALGQQAFLLWEADITAFDPAIELDLVRESQLTAAYTQLLAAAELEFAGDRVNLAGIQRYTQDANREVRYQAEKIRWEFFQQHRATLDQLYHELVQLRHQMAQTLGYDNYIGLGYRRMHRLDYTQADVERYREQVLEVVVPLANQIVQRQAEQLHLQELQFWDESVLDLQGNPVPLGDEDWILEQVQAMFDAMSETLGEFFQMMVDCRLLDLKTRPAKGGGACCKSFATHALPFIFANFNGTKSDVQIFAHELGHAFQVWQSRHSPICDYLWPTLESAEIHSLSLEFLTFPYMERFFGPQAERYRRSCLAEAFLFLPYGVAVDHFQHLVYANPGATPQQRHQMWQDMEARYLPWRRYGDLTYPAQGGLWQEKLHIYCFPFYYIDYTLAMCCALQFWAKGERDYRGALSDYIALCQRGGSASFQELTRSAKLVSPFEPGALTQVAEQARQYLGL